MTTRNPNSITSIIELVNTIGLQSAHLYDCYIYEAGKGELILDASRYVIEATLPGPKYQFYTNTYWRGNWEYKQPVGIKYEDNLLLTFMVPSKEGEWGGEWNLFSFLNYNRTQFDFPGNKNGDTYFKWKGPQKNNIYGYNIIIYPVNYQEERQRPYIYNNCFIEKIMPFKFAAESEPAYQIMTIAFTVGVESNRL
jgi:hypothetical protein